MGNLRASLIVILALASSCSSSPGPTKDDEPLPSSPSPSPSPTEGYDSCYLPLEQYCSASPCPGYEQSLVDLRQFAAGSSCWVAEVGRCGELRFTRSGPWFGNTTLYFDESGSVVAAHVTTDSGDGSSPCPFWKHYGRRVSCVRVVLETFCPR